LGIPKSTLSGWLKDIELSKELKRRLQEKASFFGLKSLIKRNKLQTKDAQKRASNMNFLGKNEIRDITKKDLLMIGVILYWAEGYKRLKTRNGKEITSHPISLTNSDPLIVFTFIQFLKKILKIPNEKIFIESRLFEHMEPELAITYWMNVTGLSRAQFKKPMYPLSSASKKIRPKNRLPYGTVQVIVSDTSLFHKILGYIDGIKEKMKMLKD
jgi:hypothetical protein